MTDLGSLMIRDTARYEITADRAPAPVWLGVLGPLSVRTPGSELRPRSSRQRRLLTILAAYAGLERAVTVDEMVEGVYGEDPTQRARHSLATELWRARQVVGTAAIVTDADGYRLDVEHCDVDSLQFEVLLSRARTRLRNDDHAGAERDLRAALALWRGDPLADWQGSAAGDAAAGRLVELYAGGRIDHAEALAGVGRREEAVRLLEAVTAAEPTREHAWALLVETASAMGNHRGARTALDAARRNLAEYGVDVGSELEAAGRLVERAGTDRPADDGAEDTTARATTTATGVVRDLHPIDVSEPAGGPGAAAGHRITDTSGRAHERRRLVGRDHESEAVLGLLRESVHRPRCTVVLVTGAAGVGKSALTEHVLEQGGGVHVLRVRCDRRSGLPYGPLVPALRLLSARGGVAHGSEMWGPLVAAEGGSAHPAKNGTAPARNLLRAAVADAVAQYARDTGGAVLFVEDVQWAPAETLEVVTDLAVQHHGVPLTILLTARHPSPMPADVEVEVAEIRRRADLVLTLSGLDLDATAELLGTAHRPDAERVHRLTGGNPLYIRHVRDLPTIDLTRRLPTLDDAVDDHLAAVSGPAADVLRLAAVIGTDFDLRLVAAAAAHADPPMSPPDVAAAVDEAIDAGLLTRDGSSDGRIGFVHELICARLYATMPRQIRTALHVRVAEAAERLVSDEPVPVDLIAHHYAAGWPVCSTETAVSRLVRAGDQAVALLGFTAAAQSYRRASDLIAMDPAFDDRARRADLLEAEAQAVVAAAGVAGRTATVDDLDRARRLFVAMGRIAGDDPRLALRSALGVSRTFTQQRVDDAVVDQITTQLQRTLAADDDVTTARGAVDEALAVLRLHRPATAATLLDRAVAIDPDAAGTLRTTAWAQQPVADRLVTARLLVEDETADPVGAWVRLWVSEVATGRRALDDPPPRRPDTGSGSDASWWEVRAWETTVAVATGRWTRAERLLDTAARRVEMGRTVAEIATRASAVAGQRTRLLILRSPDGTVSEHDVPATRWITAHPVISHPVIRSWAAHLAAVTGRHDVATRTCDDLVEEYLDGLVPEGDLLPWACGTAGSALLIGHHRAATVAREALLPHSGHFAIHTFTAYWGAVDHFLGRLAAMAGDLDEAVERLDAAVVQFRHANARPYQARALHDLALASRRRGGAAGAQAQARWRESVALFQELLPGEAPPSTWPPAN